MDNKTYKFQSVECWQEELTLAQDIAITKLFGKVDITNFSETKIIDLIQILSKGNIITEFLKIILHSANPLTDEVLLGLKNSELKGVIEDFFTLNPLVTNALGIFRSAADTLTPNTTSLNSEQSAVNTTQG